jgi:predicted enzyme related to lactoylglutathione lyase
MPWSAKLITVSYPSNSQQSRDFYSTLLGVELARSLTDQMESYHALVSTGVQLTLHPQQGAQQNAICHFAVGDLNAAIQQLTQHGGGQVAGPFDLPLAAKTLDDFKNNYKKGGGAAQVTKSVGTGVIMRDPDGNLVGLVQLEPYAHVLFQRGDLGHQDEVEHQAAVATGKKL